jgi:hypothetical protein
MYLHSSAQRNIHRAAIENGWRVHQHTGDDNEPKVQTGTIEYRRGTKDYARVNYSGALSRFHSAFGPRAHLYSVAATIEYLSRPFRGRAGADLPSPPAKIHQVVLWGEEVHDFADGNDADDFAERRVGRGDLVERYQWQLGAFFSIRGNTTGGTLS